MSSLSAGVPAVKATGPPANQPSREEWLAERRSGIGSSDAAAILGLSPWTSAYQVYLDKLGLMSPKRETAPMRWGLKLEDAIAAAYEETTHRPVAKPSPLIQRHRELPWMLASIDRWSDGRIVELKTANEFDRGSWGQEGTDAIHAHYVIQCQHQLAVADAQVCDVAVLIGGKDFRVYTVARNEALIRILIQREAEFWERVLRREPPEPEWNRPTTLALMKSLYGVDDSQAVALGSEAQETADEFRRLREQLRAIEKAKDACQAKLLFAMQEAALATLPDGSTLIRKECHRKEHVVAAGTFQRFEIKSPGRGSKR